MPKAHLNRTVLVQFTEEAGCRWVFRGPVEGCLQDASCLVALAGVQQVFGLEVVAFGQQAADAGVGLVVVQGAAQPVFVRLKTGHGRVGHGRRTMQIEHFLEDVNVVRVGLPGQVCDSDRVPVVAFA